MTERGKLIELLNKYFEVRDDDFYKGWLMNGAETIVDYLLENNVKPLPFKVNDIIYGISRGQIIPIQIDAIKYTKIGIDICGSNEEYFGYSIIHLDINNQIGIPWYKTKEEALEALKGGAK